jgi:hypothetical protein
VAELGTISARPRGDDAAADPGAHAEDTSFEKTKLSSPNDFKESLVELRIGDSGITVQPKAGSTGKVLLEAGI